MQLKMPLQNARVFVQQQTKSFQMLVFSPVATRSVTSSFQSSCSSIQITTFTLLKQDLQVCEDVNDHFADLAQCWAELAQNKPFEPCMKKCYETHSISPPFNALPFPETACIKEKNSPCSKCYMKCFPEKFQCGFGCAFEHFTSQDYNAELTTCKAETTGACYKCVDECAKASGAVAFTSITFLFSVVIASLVM